MIQLNDDQEAMLQGEQGVARQMAMRLVLDMATAAGSTELLPIQSAHVSGVSPLTGGMGLRTFLKKLSEDSDAQVAVPTTLNSAGCDAEQFDAMRIVAPDFLDHNQEIVASYTALGIRPTKSCIPYEWDNFVSEGIAAWAESNAICYGNSYQDLLTNRESGLSALAAALTGYTPRYGLLNEGATQPNLEVLVECELNDPADFSILGDWIGMQRKPSWKLTLGPIPLIRGLPENLSHEQRKALTAAAANYGSPMLYIDGEGDAPTLSGIQDRLHFDEAALSERYAELRADRPVALITIGCPQASVGELRAAAQLLKGKKVQAAPGYGTPPIWFFTSAHNREIARRTGIAEVLESAGALLLVDTCPEVVPYDRAWVSHILTNSMKAEHYIKSGLNGIHTSVMRLEDCIRVATGELVIGETAVDVQSDGKKQKKGVAKDGGDDRPVQTGAFNSQGQGLPSQSDFTVIGEAFVTDTPITLLGFVNRVTSEIEEEGHPANGKKMAGKIAIFPKGSGSTVAPYVLLELFYRGNAPIAIVNSEIDQQSAPACSLENIPYAFGFDDDVIANINDGDQVELKRTGSTVSLRVISRVTGTF